MLVMFRRGLFYSYLSIYLRHFLGLSVTATTLFATLPMIFNVVCQRYVWGIFSDRHQKRRSLIIWGEILAAAGTVLLWYAHLIPEKKLMSGYVIIAGLCVIEIFWSMSNIGWSALISDIYRKGSRAGIMGRLESIGGIGRIMGILIGGLMYDKLGTSYEGWGFNEGALFLIAAGVMAFSIIPMLMVPEGGIQKQERDYESKSSLTGEFNLYIFIIFISSMVLINFGRNSVAVILTQYLTLPDGFNLPSLTLSHVANLRSVAIILAGFLAGWASGKAGNSNILFAASLAAAAGLVLLGSTDSLFYVCISIFLMGLADVTIIASSYELASQLIPPEKRGRLFSIFNATIFLSFGTASTLITGPVADILIYSGKTDTYAYKVSFLVAAGITLAGIILLVHLFTLLKKNTDTQEGHIKYSEPED